MHYRQLAHSFLIAHQTISTIVKETCNVIWNELRGHYLKVPNTIDEWEKIKQEFFLRWNIPNTLGKFYITNIYIFRRH